MLKPLTTQTKLAIRINSHIYTSIRAFPQLGLDPLKSSQYYIVTAVEFTLQFAAGKPPDFCPQKVIKNGYLMCARKNRLLTINFRVYCV